MPLYVLSFFSEKVWFFTKKKSADLRLKKKASGVANTGAVKQVSRGWLERNPK